MTQAALAQNPIPSPVVTGVTPYVQVSDSRAAARLYERAFGAEIVALMPMGEQGKIIHGHIRINGGPLFLCDPFPEHGHPLDEPKGYTLHLQVDHAKAWFDRGGSGWIRRRHAHRPHVLGRRLRPAPRSVWAPVEHRQHADRLAQT